MQTRSVSKWSPETKRRWLKIAGIAVLELLLMGASFVGGRMLAQQNSRGRSQFALQLPSELPKDPVAGTGSVQKVQGDIITISAGRGGGFGGFGGQGGQGGQAGQATSAPIDVATTAETKFYLNTASSSFGGFGPPGGGQSAVKVEVATINDVKVGGTILVWGPKSGQRITADVIYIQSAGR